MADREAVYAYTFSGRSYDTGNKLGFLKATVEYALRREDLGEAFREYLRHSLLRIGIKKTSVSCADSSPSGEPRAGRPPRLSVLAAVLRLPLVGA